MKLIIALFFATTFQVAAQGPQVPHKMQFADLTLTIRDDARREIQKDVDAFTRYPKSFNIKVERARTYFPIIEKIFAEERVPDDLKFLVIQESALIPDAVSVSNAVGFWQFKDFTAIEMGLRVDKEIDERMNIVSSSRAAARYLKKNNAFFDNWLYALQAYQMGAGGVMRSEKETKGGVKHLEITSNTYWYVKKYLAHKIAYEGAIKGEGEIKVITYHTQSKRSLSDIARELAVDEEEIKTYNKWVKSSTIPADRTYAVAIPIKGSASNIVIPESATASAAADATIGLQDTAMPKASIKRSKDRIKINGIVAIKADENETPAKLASRAGVDLSAFLKWNDISISDRVTSGTYFFLAKKRTRATTAYHKVSSGETLWSISQHYGVQLKKLRRYNRLSSDAEVQPGMTLWLSATKPRDNRKGKTPAEVVEVVEVDKGETFNWDVNSGEKKTEVVTKVEVRDEPKAEVQQVIETPSVTKSEKVETRKPENVDSLKNLPVPVINQASVDSVRTETLINPVTTLGNEHIVQPKETLYAIARKYNVGVMDLVQWNDLDLQQGIKPGQVLKITEPQEIVKAVETPNIQEILHEVKPSDTVYSIARKYGVTIKELMEWNDKKDFNLSVGEKLKINKR